MANQAPTTVPDQLRQPLVQESRLWDRTWFEWFRAQWIVVKSAVTGSGTTGGLAKWTSDSSIGTGQLSGDGTTPADSTVLTLAATGVVAGTYGDSSHVSQVTVDTKGRVTTAANVAISSGVVPPGGANTDIQYNDAGSFGGDGNLTWDKTAQQQTVIGTGLAAPIHAATTAGDISLAPFDASANDVVLGADVTATGDWVPKGTTLLDLYQHDNNFPVGSRAGGFEVQFGLTPASPSPFTDAVGVIVRTPTDTTGSEINAFEVYGYGALGTTTPGLAVLADANTQGSGAAGTIGGYQKDGTTLWVIWQDATGAMRYGPARPTSNGSVADTSGSLFGTGNVSASATLTLNELVLGAGSDTIKTVSATDGQIPIGKTADGSVTLATLTAGANISITDGPGSITIASTASSADYVVMSDGATPVPSPLNDGFGNFIYIPYAA